MRALSAGESKPRHGNGLASVASAASAAVYVALMRLGELASSCKNTV